MLVVEVGEGQGGVPVRGEQGGLLPGAAQAAPRAAQGQDGGERAGTGRPEEAAGQAVVVHGLVGHAGGEEPSLHARLGDHPSLGDRRERDDEWLQRAEGQGCAAGGLRRHGPEEAHRVGPVVAAGDGRLGGDIDDAGIIGGERGLGLPLPVEVIGHRCREGHPRAGRETGQADDHRLVEERAGRLDRQRGEDASGAPALGIDDPLPTHVLSGPRGSQYRWRPRGRHVSAGDDAERAR